MKTVQVILVNCFMFGWLDLAFEFVTINEDDHLKNPLKNDLNSCQISVGIKESFSNPESLTWFIYLASCGSKNLHWKNVDIGLREDADFHFFDIHLDS